jgi:hypothetical protein
LTESGKPRNSQSTTLDHISLVLVVCTSFVLAFAPLGQNHLPAAMPSVAVWTPSSDCFLAVSGGEGITTIGIIHTCLPCEGDFGVFMGPCGEDVGTFVNITPLFSGNWGVPEGGFSTGLWIGMVTLPPALCNSCIEAQVGCSDPGCSSVCQTTIECI